MAKKNAVQASECLGNNCAKHLNRDMYGLTISTLLVRLEPALFTVNDDADRSYSCRIQLYRQQLSHGICFAFCQEHIPPGTDFNCDCFREGYSLRIACVFRLICSYWKLKHPEIAIISGVASLRCFGQLSRSASSVVVLVWVSLGKHHTKLNRFADRSCLEGADCTRVVVGIRRCARV